MTPDPRIIEQIEALVAFDTVSRNSNLDLIHYLRDHLAGLGVEVDLVRDAHEAKANLYATVGPTDRPGVALSGHTDVVPVDGQAWTSDPFQLTRREDRLFGRGTADMKSFIAVAVALLPELLAGSIETPVHLAFSYDEEVGCLGVRSLLAWLRERPVVPRGVIVGEPTGMEVITAHKGKLSLRARVRGLESHSGLAHLGVNAVEAAAEAVAFLKGLARRHRDHGPFDPDLVPPYTTIHTGVLNGGTQLNIVPRECTFDFEIRHLPQDDPEGILDELKEFVASSLLPEMEQVDPAAGFEWLPRARIPGLAAAADSEVVQLALGLTGRNRTGKVSFGTEAGLFETEGMPAVICGPGHIEQAHKPDEYVSLDQIAACERFMRQLYRGCAADPFRPAG